MPMGYGFQVPGKMPLPMSSEKALAVIFWGTMAAHQTKADAVKIKKQNLNVNKRLLKND